MSLPLPSSRPVPLLTYEDVVAILGEEIVQVIHDDSFNPISGVTMDSRDIYFGEMFLALDGERFRGIDFIPTAYARGVRTFTVEERYLPDLKKLPEEAYQRGCFLMVKDALRAYQLLAEYYLARIGGLRIAITGSAGKTTTKEILARILGGSYGVFCSYRNENNHLGLPKNVFSLQRRLTGGEDFSVLIFELGMNHAGEISRLASLLKPHLAIITNILYSHIGNFSRREDLVLAKGEVIPHLVGHDTLPDYPGGLLLIPQDIFGQDLLNQINEIRGKYPTPKSLPIIKQVGATVTTEFFLRDKNDHGGNHTRKEIVSRWTDTLSEETTTIPGFSVFGDKLLPLILEVGEVLGIPRREGFPGLAQALQESVKSSRSPFHGLVTERRLQIIDRPGKPLIIDDAYNANPDSVIETVADLISLFPQFPPPSRLRIVLGDMLELGDFSESLHRECGKSIQRIIGLSADGRDRIGFFFLGKEMKVCYDNISLVPKKYYTQYSANHPDRDSQILQDLKESCDIDSVVFFKASNGMNFDRLINKFIDLDFSPRP